MAKKTTESKGRQSARKAAGSKATAKKSSSRKHAASKAKKAPKKAKAGTGRALKKASKSTKAASSKAVKKTARGATKKTTKGAAKKVVRKKKVAKASTKRGGTRGKAKRAKHESLRQRLVEQREEIVGVYNSDLRRGQEAGNEGTEDIVDRANNAYNRELTFSLSDSERQKLLLIEEALTRLNEGRYGLCTHCGQKIAEGRLQVVPWARYCIDCQELQEKGLLEEA